MAYRIVAYLMLCLLLISSSVSVSVARTFDRIIAYVNDDVVTKRELDVLVKQRAMELQQVYRYSEREALNESERQRPELLDRLIRQMLLLEAALTLKITVSDVDIEQYVQDFKKRYQIETDEEFEKQLNREGMTLFAFREQSERNLKAERLVMGRIVPRLQVRDSEIQKFFEENRDQLPTKSDIKSVCDTFLLLLNRIKPTEMLHLKPFGKCLMKSQQITQSLKNSHGGMPPKRIQVRKPGCS